MVEPLLRPQQVGGPADYLDLARRVLTSFGGTVRALLGDGDDAVARAPDTVYYLRAYAQVVSRRQDGEQRRWARFERLRHDLIGSQQQRCGNVYPESFRGLEVEDELELVGSLDRQGSGVGPLPDAGEVGRGARGG